MYRQVELCYILDPFAKFRKRLLAESVFPPVRPSVRMEHGFTWNLVSEYVSKFCRENLTKITGTLHEDQYTYLIISRSILLRLRNP